MFFSGFFGGFGPSTGGVKGERIMPELALDAAEMVVNLGAVFLNLVSSSL